MTRKYLCFLFLSLFFVGASNIAKASIVVPLSLEQRVEQAQTIVVGTVVDQQVHRDEQGHIITISEVSIEEAIKGKKKKGEIVFVHTLGGIIGNIGMHVPGEAQLKLGMRTVLFLSDFAGNGWIRPVGMDQGVIPIFKEDGKDVVKFADPHSVHSQHTTPLKSEVLSLDAFVGRIKKAHQAFSSSSSKPASIEK